MTDSTRSTASSLRADRLQRGIAVARALVDRAPSPASLARATGVALSVVSVGFPALLLFTLASHGQLSLFTRPLSMRIALALPFVVAALAACTSASVVLAWWRGYWSVRARVHQTLLAVLGLVYTVQLASLGFLPS